MCRGSDRNSRCDDQLRDVNHATVSRAMTSCAVGQPYDDPTRGSHCIWMYPQQLRAKQFSTQEFTPPRSKNRPPHNQPRHNIHATTSLEPRGQAM